MGRSADRCTPAKTHKAHGKTIKTPKKCTTKLISGGAAFTTATARASLTRRGVLYATGTADLTRLKLHALRRLRPGRYTLTLTHGHGHRQNTTRQPITIA